MASNGCGDATYDTLSAYKKVTMHRYIDYTHGCEGVRTTQGQRELHVTQIEPSVLTIRYEPRRVVWALALFWALLSCYSLAACIIECRGECFSDYTISLLVCGSIYFLILFYRACTARSQICILNKEQNAVTCEWRGWLGTKLGAKTVKWSLQDVIAVEIDGATKGEEKFLRVCLVSGDGTQLPVCAHTLDRFEATYLSERIHQFLNLRSPIRT